LLVTMKKREPDERDDRGQSRQPQDEGVARKGVQYIAERNFLDEKRDREQERSGDEIAVCGIPQRRIGATYALK